MSIKLRTLLDNRLILIVLALLVTHLLILSFYIQMHDERKQALRDNKTAFLLAELIINASQTAPDAELNTILAALSSDQFILNNHHVMITINPYPHFSTQFAAQNSWATIRNTLESKNQNKFSYLFKNGAWLNYSEAHIYHTHEFAALLIVAELVIISMILFYSFSLQRFSIPLKNIQTTAERLGTDINSQPILENGPKLVRETASVMNKMQNRITDLIQTRTQMLAAISHDLRTPITRLKLRAQFISEQEHSKKIVNDLDEMEAMIDGILSFASEDVIRDKKTSFDFNSLLTAICEDFIDQGNMVHITTNGEKKPFLGSPLAIKRALSNMIQNALKYAGEVWVQFNHLTDKVIIVIEDNGPGIPQDSLLKVFEPFYREQNANTAGSTGVGLGLTIAYEIIRAHAGSIVLKNRAEGGLQATVIFPLQ